MRGGGGKPLNFFQEERRLVFIGAGFLTGRFVGSNQVGRSNFDFDRVTRNSGQSRGHRDYRARQRLE